MEETIITIKIEQHDFEALKIIRNYFGEHDESHLEHMAFKVLDRIVSRFK